LDLLLDEEKGIWHLTNQGAVSWHDLAAEIADRAKLDRRRIVLPEEDVPANTSLTSDRGLLLRPLGPALDDFMRYAEPLRELQ
jgi:dTDP-4-dehydrorhamnose reductase